MPSTEEATVKALIAVDALVGTLHLAAAVTEDATAAAALDTALLSALTARNMLEAAVEGDPVKEPHRPAQGMGQDDDDDTPIFLGMTAAECEHEHWVEDSEGNRMCRACGEDPFQ